MRLTAHFGSVYATVSFHDRSASAEGKQHTFTFLWSRNRHTCTFSQSFHTFCVLTRYLKIGKVAEYRDESSQDGRRLLIGVVRTFCVVKYRYTSLHPARRPRCGRFFTGEEVMVKLAILDPPPTREDDIYVCKERSLWSYRPGNNWLPVEHLTSFLKVVPDRAGDIRKENLVTIAHNFNL